MDTDRCGEQTRNSLKRGVDLKLSFAGDSDLTVISRSDSHGSPLLVRVLGCIIGQVWGGSRVL